MADNKKEVIMHELKSDLGELRHLISKLLDPEAVKDRSEKIQPQERDTERNSAPGVKTQNRD